MSSQAVVTLPALTPRVRYQGVPRRYEETKPVVVRDLTHRKILDLGLSVHQKTLDQCAIEKEVAVAAAEEAVWQQAEGIKEEALQRVQERAQKDHEKVVRKLSKAHEKAIREERLRVVGEMEKVAHEALETEKAAGERRLEEAVAATEARCLQEKLAAVAEARKEEVEVAANRAVQVAQVEAEKLAAAIKKAASEKAEALQVLEARKEKERADALAKLQQEEQEAAAQKLAVMEQAYEEKLMLLKQQIVGLNVNIGELKDELTEVKAHRRLIVQELVETRQEYQQFINKTNPFEKGKSDYVIPPIKSVDPENFE